MKNFFASTHSKPKVIKMEFTDKTKYSKFIEKYVENPNEYCNIHGLVGDDSCKCYTVRITNYNAFVSFCYISVYLN